MIPNHSIQPEPDSLSVRWTLALIMSCLSLTFVRLFRSGVRPTLPLRDASSLSHGITQFLNAATTAKNPPMARLRNVRYTTSSVFTSSQSPRAVELPRPWHAVIGGQDFAPRGRTASRQGSFYDAEDDRQFSRSGRNSDCSFRQRETH